MTDYLAHVRRKEDGSFTIHHLEDHLRAVGDLAGRRDLAIHIGADCRALA
jgi:hypothetical protein